MYLNILLIKIKGYKMVAIKNEPSKYEVYQFKLKKIDELNELLEGRLIKHNCGVGIQNKIVCEGPISENSYLVNIRGDANFHIISEERFNRDFKIISNEHTTKGTLQYQIYR